MVKKPMMIEGYIAMKELYILKDYETLMGRPLAFNLFWTVQILLACDTQSKVYIVQGIREALSLIQMGQQERYTTFRLLEQIGMEVMDIPGDNSTTPQNAPTNSLANEETSTLHPQQEEHHPGPNLDARR